MATARGGIEARALGRSFAAVRALDGLDLRVPEGELYGLVGPNGSGKTTLIRILVGLDDADAGEARVLGAHPGRSAARVGYMPQEEALYPDLSVEENLAFFAGLYGVRAETPVREALGLVRLWKERRRIVGELSGGMRRRVSLAAALVHAPEAIFLDEPTVGVDPLLRREFWASFRERAEAGAAILITTHQIEEARRCDRIGLLWRGRLLREGPPEGILREAGASSLEDAFATIVERADAEADA